MPTNFILEDIFAGNFSEENYPNLPKKDTIKHVLDDLLLLCNGEHTFLRQGLVHVKCFYPDAKEPKIEKYLQDNLGNGHLKNLINFFTQKIGEYQLSEEETKNLISFGKHYNAIYEEKIKLSDSKFAEIDIQTTISFINFLTRLFNQKNIEKFDETNILVSNTLQLSESLIQSNCSKENLLDLLKNLGDLGFELKIKEPFQDLSPKIQSIAYDAIHSNKFNSTEDKELAGYTFLFRFHAGMTSEIQSDCENFLVLKRCPKPVTANNQLFQRIIHGNYINLKPSFSDFEQIKDEINQNLNSLNHASQFHLFTFLKNILKNNSKSDFDFKLLYRFVFTSINKLTQDLEQQNNLDNSFTQATESLFLFLFNIVKNNVNDRDLYDQIHIVRQFSQFYEKIINHAPHLNNLLDTLNKHLFNILDRNINSELALKTGSHEFLAIIKDLNKVCRETHNCENLKIKILARSFRSLGSISRKSNVYKLSAMNETQELIKSTGANLNSRQLSDAISYFFQANITQNDLNRQCQQTFNLTGCRPASLINLDASEKPVGDINNIITTKFIPTTTTPITPPAANTTTISPSTKQTITDIENSTLTTENNETYKTLSNPALVLGTAAAHGAGTGMLNGIIQYFATKYSRKGEQSSKAKAIFIYSSLLAHAAFAATLPLMLYKIQEHINQGNEDEAQQLWDNLMLQALPTFISSVGLSMGLQIVYECTQLLSNRVSAIVQNTLPLVGTAASLFKNPVATAVQMATSIVISSLTYGLSNRISPVNNTNFLDEEKDNVEMNPLNTKNDVKPTVNGIVGSEIIEKTYLYITKEKLDEIRNQSEDVKKLLSALVSSLEKNIEKDISKIDSDTNPAVADTYQTIIDNKVQVLQIIKQEVKNCNTEISLLNDDHKEAYKNYVIQNTHNPEEKKKIKDDYSLAMNKLGNVFKRMEPMFNEMKTNLGKAHGYVKGASKSFAGDDTLASLDEIMNTIQFPLSLTKTYISAYNTWDAAEKGERNGAIKALANKKIFEKNLQPNTSQITSRSIKSRTFLNNRPQSVDSDSRTYSSGSEEGSVISTGSSKDKENAWIVRPLLKSSR